MKQVSHIEAVAKAIRVRVGKVRAYVERLKERGQGSEPIQPPTYKLAAIKAAPIPAVERLTAIQEGAPPQVVEPEARHRWELDDLYDKWAAASPEERPAVMERMHKPAHELGSAVGWQELQENDPYFPNDVVTAIIAKVPRFKRRNKAKFSTYAYSIATKQAIEWKRKRGRYRKRVDAYVDYDEEVGKYESDAWRIADARVLEADLSKGLSKEEQALLDLMCEGRDPRDIAQVLKITQHAAESRIRRLRNKLRKKIESK